MERENRDITNLKNWRTLMTDLSSRHLLSGYCDTDMVIRMGKLRMGLQNYMKVKIMQLLT